MNNIEQVSSLLKHKADPNIVNDEGISPLHIAVLKGNVQIVKLLLENNANPNLQSERLKQTPLHFAYQQSSADEIINLLLQYQASNNMIDRSDKKPSDYITPLPYSENNTNTFQENTFTLENHLDSFITTNKDEVSKIHSIKDINETVQSNLNITPNQINTANSNNSNTNIFSELHEPNGSEEKTPKKEDDEGDEEDNNCLEDSLEEENELAYSKSKSYYVSDFPLSSMKKENVRESTQSNQDIHQINQSNINNINMNNNNGINGDNSNEIDNVYKKLILAKRLNFCNNKLSYHVKNNDSKSNSNLNSTLSKLLANNTNTMVTNTVIHNVSERNSTNPNNVTNNMNKISSFLNSTNNGINNYTDLEINPYSTNNKNNSNNLYSNYSTQPQSNRFINSLRSRKKFQSQNYDYMDDNNTIYGKVSEFTIQKALPRYSSNGNSKEEIAKLKQWLCNIELAQYVNLFITNDFVDIDALINSMKSYETKLKFDDLEILGIKKPGHIYRILTKLEIDSGLIDSKIIHFILPNNKIGLGNPLEASAINKVNLKISNEYCCGCISSTNYEMKNDLKMWLRKNNLMHFYSNFNHNGFDNLEFIILQMYSAYPISDEILENCFHIYEAEDRQKVLKCLVEEMKKINLFVNTEEYNANYNKYKYLNLQLERDEFGGCSINNNNRDKEICNPCVIF